MHFYTNNSENLVAHLIEQTDSCFKTFESGKEFRAIKAPNDIKFGAAIDNFIDVLDVLEIARLRKQARALVLLVFMFNPIFLAASFTFSLLA